MSKDSSTTGRLIANAITPVGLAPGDDASGGKVGSLTEAVMGITAGLVKIADAIERLASAVEDGVEIRVVSPKAEVPRVVPDL